MTVRALVLPVLATLLLAAGCTPVSGSVPPDLTGSRWLLDHAPAVEATGFGGALLGDHWHAERVRIVWAGGQASLTLEDLRADGLTWHWRPHPQAWLGVDVQNLAARRVTVVSGPPGARPLPVPTSNLTAQPSCQNRVTRSWRCEGQTGERSRRRVGAAGPRRTHASVDAPDACAPSSPAGTQINFGRA